MYFGKKIFNFIIGDWHDLPLQNLLKYFCNILYDFTHCLYMYSVLMVFLPFCQKISKS